MTDIEKKILPEYFDPILAGEKNYELRLGDFECQPGDTLILREWDPNKNDYTGRELKKTVTYVGKFKPNELFWSPEEIQEKGLQIISFKPDNG